MRWIKIDFNKKIMEENFIQFGIKELSEIIKNFKDEIIRVPVDFPGVHYGESLRMIAGMVRELKISNGNLFAKIEFSKIGKEYIKEEKKIYFTPSIVFGYKDHYTGKNLGCVFLRLVISSANYPKSI